MIVKLHLDEQCEAFLQLLIQHCEKLIVLLGLLCTQLDIVVDEDQEVETMNISDRRILLDVVHATVII